MHPSTVAAQQRQQVIAGRSLGISAGELHKLVESSQPVAQPEINCELQRLTEAALTVQSLACDLAERLRPLRNDLPQTDSNACPAETQPNTPFGASLRDISRTLEATADGLRYQLKALAIA